MALTKTGSVVTDWTAIAQNATFESGTADISDCYDSTLHIQAFLDSTTANLGVEVAVQVSSKTTGDEDWQDIVRFVDLVGTAAKITTITNNPLAVGEGTSSAKITETSIAAGFSVNELSARWVGIKDNDAIANSELGWQIGYTSNQDIWLQDGVTNAHSTATDIYSIAFSRAVNLPFGALRARVIANNNFDNGGSSLCMRVSIVKVTGV